MSNHLIIWKLRKLIPFPIALAALLAVVSQVQSQPYTLEIEIRDQPFNHLTFGKVSGDNFVPLDTILIHLASTQSMEKLKKAQYTFPENFSPGIYRLVFGQTTYAKVMDEPPQQLDFIFNNENLIFKTDFDAPEDSLLVVLSEENRTWFNFLKDEKQLKKELTEVELEVDYYREKLPTLQDDESNSGSQETTNFRENHRLWRAAVSNYNALQKQREKIIAETAEKDTALLASEMISMYREPFLNGNLTQEERKEQFRKDFFNGLEFNDERLVNSSVYTDRIFYYLTSYNRPGFTKDQLENEYIKAVDIILENTNQNPKVYEFILGYLVHGFEVLKMDKVLNYIANR